MSEWEPGGPGPSPLFGGLFVSARWYPLYTGASGSTIVVQGHLYAVPFYVGTSHRFTAIGAFITTGGSAGATAELGIYADNGEGYPGALVLDAGSVAVVSTGAAAEISGLTQTLAPGLYWLVYGATGSPVTQATPSRYSSPPVVIVGGSGPTAVSIGYDATGALTGALPAAYPAGANVTATAPIVQLEAA